MTVTPAPESVRKLALEIERALTIMREAVRNFEAEMSPPEDAPFPQDRPASRDQLQRIESRLKSPLLDEEEVAKVRAFMEKRLTYVQARDLIARIDAQLEARDAERRRAAAGANTVQ